MYASVFLQGLSIQNVGASLMLSEQMPCLEYTYVALGIPLLYIYGYKCPLLCRKQFPHGHLQCSECPTTHSPLVPGSTT